MKKEGGARVYHLNNGLPAHQYEHYWLGDSLPRPAGSGGLYFLALVMWLLHLKR